MSDHAKSTDIDMADQPRLPHPSATPHRVERLTDLAHADLHLLPPNMQWVARIIGLPATIKLAKAHGGRFVYVPKQVSLDHPLCHLIGAQACAALVAEYGGERLDVAKCDRAAQALRNQLIREKRREASQSDVAGQFGLTVRRVRDIEKDIVEDRQIGLF